MRYRRNGKFVALDTRSDRTLHIYDPSVLCRCPRCMERISHNEHVAWDIGEHRCFGPCTHLLHVDAEWRPDRSRVLYAALIGIGATIDHHASDLYVRATDDQVWDLVRRSGLRFTTFNSAGEPWIDVPFAYIPYWDEKKESR